MMMTHENFISNAQLLGIMCLIVPALSILDPSFLTSPSNQTACEGSTVIQQCQISRGKACLWFLNGTRINNVCTTYLCQGDFMNGECAIVIVPANPLMHSGTWQCGYYHQNDNSSEEVTVKSDEAHLLVLGFPVAPRISATINETLVVILQEITYTENDRVELKCTAQCSKIPTQFTWYIGDKSYSIVNTTITIGLSETESKYENLKDETNSGSILKCGVKHNGQTQELQTPPLILDFQYATNSANLSNTGRQIVAKGTRTVYKCIANGNPAPECEWLMWAIGGKQLQTVQEHGSCNYVIESFSASDEGRYTCMAGNIHSKGHHFLSSDVLFLVFGDRIKNKVAIVGGVIGGLLVIVIIGMTVTIVALRRRGERPKFGQKMLPVLRTPEYTRKINNIASENDYLSPSIRGTGESVRYNRKDSDSDTIYEEIVDKNTIYLGVLPDQSSA